MEKKGFSTGFFVVLNDKGLHTRPSTELARCASSFRSVINLVHNGRLINAKSLLSILMLAAIRGTKIEIRAEGEDAEAAVQALLMLAEQKFNIDY